MNIKSGERKNLKSLLVYSFCFIVVLTVLGSAWGKLSTFNYLIAQNKYGMNLNHANGMGLLLLFHVLTKFPSNMYFMFQVQPISHGML